MLSHSSALHSQDSVLSATETIDQFIALRQQLAALEQQLADLQPAFYAACTSFGIDKIATQQALITRKLTPGKWEYSPSILAQEEALKKLKLQFQKDYEPVAGREVIWAVKLLGGESGAAQ